MVRKHNLVSSTKFLLLLFVLTFASAAMFTGSPARAQSTEDASTESIADYIIGPEDVLEISVWKNEDLSKIVTVRPDGKISLPLVGDVKAAGLSPEELKNKITFELKSYLETAVVSVIIQEVNSYKVFITGEVNSPGTYKLKSKTTFLQVISMAGGFTPYASKNDIVLVRLKDDTSVEKIKVRFNDLVYKEEAPIILMPGDSIFVP